MVFNSELKKRKSHIKNDMGLKGIIIITLLVVFLETASANCPVLCDCDDQTLVTCREQGLLQPPAGYWPDITDLYIVSNNISTLNNKSFSGFPNLKTLNMAQNPLTKLDFGIFEGMNELNQLGASICFITSLTPLSLDKVLPELQLVSLFNNKISSLPSNLISNLPKLKTLYLSGNPIVVPATGPWIPSNSLQVMDLGRVSAGAMTSETLKGLPNLNRLSLDYSGLTDISEIFAVLPKLTFLYINDNPIQVIKKGTFSKEQKIQEVLLHGSQLEVLETGAVDGILIGALEIQDTPLACECKYESLYWWAQLNGVDLRATCEDKPPCNFVKK